MSTTEIDDPNQVAPKTIQKDDLKATEHFEISAVYEGEQNRIFAYLRKQANVSASVKRPSEEQGGRDLDSTIATLVRFFEPPGDKMDRELYAAALKNKLAEKAPSRASTTAYGWVTLIALFLEIAIAALMMILGQGTVSWLIIAALLAGGGYMAGNGLAGILNRKIHYPDWSIVPDGRVSAMHIVKLVVGALIVIGLSVARAVAADDPASVFMIIGITGGLAVTVAIFEALHAHTKEKYRKLRDKMFDAQTWYARERHEKAKDDYCKIFRNERKRILLESDSSSVEPRGAAAGTR